MKKIMNLGKLGQYELVRVLDGFDYGRIFVCKNEKDTLLLFAEMDSNEDGEKWVAISIDSITYSDLLLNKITIQKAFINACVDNYYIVSHDYETDAYFFTIEKQMPDNVISKEEFYVGVDIEAENEVLVNSALEAYKQKHTPILDFHLNPYTNNHSVKAGFLMSLIESVKTIYNQVTKTRKDNLLVEPLFGSCIIRFKSLVSETVIEKNTPSNAFRIISSIVSSASTDDVVEDIKDNPSILRSAKDLVNSLAKEKQQFDVIFANDENEKPLIKNVEPKTIDSLNNQLKDLSISVEEPEEFNGVLSGYDTTRKTFSFKSDGGVIMKGKLSKDFYIEEHLVPSKYKVSIKAIKTYNSESDTYKSSYELISIISSLS